jgi:hypothetical protein
LTKSFYHGRTEAMRSATPQAKELCQLWSKGTPEQKISALRRATLEHSRLVKEAAAGMGVDRHLFSLKCIAEKLGMPVPPFFQSEAWKTLNHPILSTSNCGNPALRLFGFGPVVPDGFGVGYIIKDNGLSFSVSSKHRQTQRYVRSLNNTLKEIQEILTPVTSMEVNPRARKKVGVVSFAESNEGSYDLSGEETACKALEESALEDTGDGMWYYGPPAATTVVHGFAVTDAPKLDRKDSLMKNLKERRHDLKMLRKQSSTEIVYSGGSARKLND